MTLARRGLRERAPAPLIHQPGELVPSQPGLPVELSQHAGALRRAAATGVDVQRLVPDLRQRAANSAVPVWRLDARTTVPACFEPRRSAALLSMTPPCSENSP